MKECINCKAILDDDELFCHECGTKQEIEKAEAQEEETTEPQGKKCIYCGETIDDDSLFCPYCGKQQNEPSSDAIKEDDTASEIDDHPKDTKETSRKNGKQDYKVETESHNKQENMSTCSNKWLWALLIVLVAGGISIISYLSKGFSFGGSNQIAVDSDSIAVVDSAEVYGSIESTDPLVFLKQFYKGDLNDVEYIKQHVEENVVDKLKRDYRYDCPSNDCLATWVFTAYPPGSDLQLEEGPIITKSEEDGKYCVVYKYYAQGQSGIIYKPRKIILSVIENSSKCMIADYELVMPDVVQKPSDLLDDIDGQYYLQSGNMTLHFLKKDSQIKADFDFRDGTCISNKYIFEGSFYNNLSAYVSDDNNNRVGTIEMELEGNFLKVNVKINNSNGEYYFNLTSDEYGR